MNDSLDVKNAQEPMNGIPRLKGKPSTFQANPLTNSMRKRTDMAARPLRYTSGLLKLSEEGVPEN